MDADPTTLIPDGAPSAFHPGSCSLRNLVSQAIIDLMTARSHAVGAELFEHRHTEATNRRRRAIHAVAIEMRAEIVRRLFQTRHYKQK